MQKEGIDYPLYVYYLVSGMREALSKKMQGEDDISVTIPLPYFYAGISLARKTLRKCGYECSLYSYKKTDEKWVYRFRVKTAITKRE